MARKLKNVENETQTLFKLNWRETLKNGENEKCTLQDPEYGEKTENHEKWEIQTLGGEIWRGKLKKVENLEMSTVGRGIWQEN